MMPHNNGCLKIQNTKTVKKLVKQEKIGRSACEFAFAFFLITSFDLLGMEYRISAPFVYRERFRIKMKGKKKEREKENENEKI